MDYFYFEIHKLMVGKTVIEEEINNVNGLYLKPHTNSDGIWSFRNLTQRNDVQYLVVDQYWVDTKKFNFDRIYFSEYGDDIIRYTKKAMEILQKRFEQLKGGIKN